MRRVAILGATGVFGARLARHLARHPRGLGALELLLVARGAERLEALARDLRAPGGPAVRTRAVDLRRDLPGLLAAEAPWAVVDCSGPFQGMGHGTTEAVLEAGAHAVDLADARDYLAGYAALNGIARRAGVTGLAGASSTPALSGAVARELVSGWPEVERVEAAILPGGRGEVGRAVLEAVLGYAGRPVPVWRGGALAHVPGWIGGRALRVEGLGQRRVHPVETYDAERLGPLLGAREIRFHAGLESGVERLGLGLVARLRRAGLAPDPRPLAAALVRLRRLTGLLCGDVGAMVVTAEGRDAAGAPLFAHWTLIAREGDGPQIPTLPAAAALRALARGAATPGAYVADDVLSRAEIEAEMGPYAITADLRRTGPDPRRAGHEFAMPGA